MFKGKIFVVGCNKTGTTSLAYLLPQMGYRLGDQAVGEMLMNEWAQRRFVNIANYCQSADVFQDLPFSLPYTYQAMDMYFPGSKFILSVRDSDEVWYQSLVRFHTKILELDRVPTFEDLSRANINWGGEGWMWKTISQIVDVDESDPYSEEVHKRQYNNHNAAVIEYFRHRPGDLLILNLSDVYAVEKLCQFLDVPNANYQMPYLNRSE